MNIFERAARAKLRFESMIGDLTTEQLWDLPLTVKASSTRADLDTMARGVNFELKSLEEESFVNITPDPRKSELELKLDILKHVIEAKLAEQAAAAKRAENTERRKKLMNVLASKEDEALKGMSREDIEAEIAKLDA